MTVIAQPSHVPLAYVRIGDSRYPCYINTPWYQFIGQDLPGVVGPPGSLDELFALARSKQVIEVSDEGEAMVIPGPPGPPGPVATQNILWIIEDQIHEEIMFVPR